MDDDCKQDKDDYIRHTRRENVIIDAETMWMTCVCGGLDALIASEN